MDDEHASELHYTTDDDGIWLMCRKHNWEMSLGFCPSITTAAEAWAQHVIDVNTPREQ